MGPIEIVALFAFIMGPVVAIFVIVCPVLRDANEELRKCEIERRKFNEESRKLDEAYRRRIEILKG